MKHAPTETNHYGDAKLAEAVQVGEGYAMFLGAEKTQISIYTSLCTKTEVFFSMATKTPVFITIADMSIYWLCGTKSISPAMCM